MIGGGDTPEEETLVAINTPSPQYSYYQFGIVRGSTYEVEAKNNHVVIASSAGAVISVDGQTLDGDYLNLVILKMNDNGYPITSVIAKNSTLAVGDRVENWDSYTKLNA